MNKTNSMNRVKLLHLTLITIIILSVTIGIARCVPVDEYIDGLKIFPDGIRIGTDPNNAFDPNGNITAKTLGLGVAKDPNYAIKANGFTVDPNGVIISNIRTDLICQQNISNRGLNVYQNNSGAHSPIINFYKSYGTYASPSIVSNSSYAGLFNFKSYGSSYLTTSSFGARINGTVSAGSVPTDLFFATSGGSDDVDPYVNNHVRLLIKSDGKIGFNTTVPTADLSFGGGSARTIWLERHTTADGAGSSLTLQSGGATASATDKAGGNLLLKSGISTGDGGSQIDFYGVAVSQGAGTTDRNPTLTASITGTGLTMATGKTITLSGGGSIFSCNIEPTTNDTYYLGKNSTTSDQKAYKGVILKDTANTKTYRLEVTNGAVIATEIYTP